MNSSGMDEHKPGYHLHKNDTSLQEGSTMVTAMAVRFPANFGVMIHSVTAQIFCVSESGKKNSFSSLNSVFHLLYQSTIQHWQQLNFTIKPIH